MASLLDLIHCSVSQQSLLGLRAVQALTKTRIFVQGSTELRKHSPQGQTALVLVIGKNATAGRWLTHPTSR